MEIKVFALRFFLVLVALVVLFQGRSIFDSAR